MAALKSMGMDIDEPPLAPPQLKYLYDLFFSIRFSWVFNGEDYQLQPRQPLTNQDIEYYDKNNGMDFDAWEIEVILSLDATFNMA